MAQPVPPPRSQPTTQARPQGSHADEQQFNVDRTDSSHKQGILEQSFSSLPATPWSDTSHVAHLGSQTLEHKHSSSQQSHTPFHPPFMHPNLAHLMQQTHILMMQQQQQQLQGQPYDSNMTPLPPPPPPGLGVSSFEGRNTIQDSTPNQWNPQQQRQHDFDNDSTNTTKGQLMRAGSTTLISNQQTQEGPQQTEGENQPLTDRPPINSQHQQGMFHSPVQHNRLMFSGPPGFEGEFRPPGMMPMQTPNGIMFVPMNEMAPHIPPPGFGHFPIHPSNQEQFATHQPQGSSFQSTLQHQQQQQFLQQQMFIHQQMLRQQHQLQQMYQNHGSSQNPLHQEQLQGSNSSLSIGEVTQRQQQQQEQQNQIKSIESHINQLLFHGESKNETPTAHGNATLDGSQLTVQEIEEAQVRYLQGQFRRFSLGDPVSPSPPTPPHSRTIPTVPNQTISEGSQVSSNPMPTQPPASSQHFSNIIQNRFRDPFTTRYEQPTDKAPFSVKDIDFYSDRKYDPYRPASFDQITREAKEFCQDLMPKPEEETRKLALLQKLSEIAIQVFGEAEVLPFGSSGNGLALANADMDLCVFLNPKGTEEVTPVEFVERIGDRLEKDPDFENILQLKRARVPIVKLNHVNGIACDIGYQNDLAIWNTRLLRAYCMIDERLRDIVLIIKIWAKRRKINNPYTGSLSSYAYVLLVIHVLQRQGVLPNLQSIVAGNGKIPFWECQGFNRYFFEDIPNLSRYWQPTPESQCQSVGELLYEFFRYYASEFRYANQVVSIRSGGLLTKEAKEWTKDHTQQQYQYHHQQQQSQQQSQQSQQSQQQGEALLSEEAIENAGHAQAAPAAESKPIVKNRYLFCIEDPFELDHNVGRPVDRYSLFTIRGEFMRAAKILSRRGDGVISRLCMEREVPVHQERNRNGSISHGDDQDREKLGLTGPNTTASEPRTSFSTGEDRPGGTGSQETESSLGNDNDARRSGGRRNYYKRATIGSEPRHFNRS
ncbi:hypothetical protein FBU30_000732 [Linnemannia zychae]|nr:hypothetical protein FBU30_000732 [Linnemannia zychae]